MRPCSSQTCQSWPSTISGATRRRGAGLDHLERVGVLAADDAEDAGLEDAGLLAGDLGQGVAEVLLVVDGDRGDDGEARPVDDVGGVEAAAEPDLEQREVGRGLGHREEGGGGGDLEEGDRLAGVRGLAAFAASRRGGPRRSARRRGGCARGSARGAARCRRAPAAPPPRARRAASPRPSPCRWCRRRGPPAAAGARGGRARPAGARSGRATGRSPWGAARSGARGSASLGGIMERGAGASSTGAGRSPCTNGGWLVRSRSRVASSSRMSLRVTTRSSMPWSSRYSARWKPSGRVSRMVCSITRGPAKQISAPGSAICTSPSMA